MAGAYLTLSPLTCQVYLSSSAIQGGSVWYGGLPSVSGTIVFDVNRFNFLYPGYVTVPYHCLPTGGQQQPPVPPVPPQQPPAKVGDDDPKIGPRKPITGDPPPSECGDGVAIALIGDNDDRRTSSSFWKNGDAPSNTCGSGTFDVLAQPLVGGMTPLPLFDGTSQTAKPTYTQEPFFKIRTGDDHAIADVYHEGTGPGLVVLHPPELEDYQLYGSGLTPGSAWPSNLSQTTLLIMHGGVEGATGLARGKLAFGMPLRTLVSPSDGWLINMGQAGSGDSLGLVVCPTNTAGGADTATDRKFLIKANIRGEAALELAEITPPGTPDAGFGSLYIKADGLVYFKNDAGDEFDLTESGIATDHGGLTGLADDDHLQYLTEVRHDDLAADNPHSVTLTQSVAADAGTDITAAELETLSDGSNADALHVHAGGGTGDVSGRAQWGGWRG